jgi:ectoine hydroxylase-related dioxygenase (phytanoyl-CoA dioxygenase family)
MNWRTIAAKLAAGEIHYALGRFYSVRRTYSVISGLRWPPNPPDTQMVSIFRQEMVDTAVRSLHADGVAAGFDLPAGIVAAIREYAERSTCRRSGDRRQFTFSEAINGKLPDDKPVVLGIVDNPRACLEINRLCTDPILLAVASQYLGYCPQNVEARLYWSFVCSVTREDRLAQWQTIDYHFDVDGYNFIYANFYITDIDKDSGPHTYIRSSHKRKPWRMLLHSANQTDEAIFKSFGKDNEVLVEGAAGYGFMEDASCYHRATPPKTRERLMLQLRIR